VCCFNMDMINKIPRISMDSATMTHITNVATPTLTISVEEPGIEIKTEAVDIFETMKVMASAPKNGIRVKEEATDESYNVSHFPPQMSEGLHMSKDSGITETVSPLRSTSSKHSHLPVPQAPQPPRAGELCQPLKASARAFDLNKKTDPF